MLISPIDPEQNEPARRINEIDQEENEMRISFPQRRRLIEQHSLQM